MGPGSPHLLNYFPVLFPSRRAGDLSNSSVFYQEGSSRSKRIYCHFLSEGPDREDIANYTSKQIKSLLTVAPTHFE